MGHHFHRSTGPSGPLDGLEVIRRYGNRPAFDVMNGGWAPYGRMGKNALHCADGFSVSVTAGHGMHCLPKPGFQLTGWRRGGPVELGCPLNYTGPYTAFEIGYPSAIPEPWSLWREFASDRDDWTFIYSYVPYVMVRALVNRHGGLARMGNGVTQQQPPETFTCPACHRTSPHPDDVANRYCFACHWYTGVPELAAQRPELFTRYGRRPPDSPWDHDHHQTPTTTPEQP